MGNQDLLSCLDRFYEFGHVTDEHPSQPEPEKESSGGIKEVKKIMEKLKVNLLSSFFVASLLQKLRFSFEGRQNKGLLGASI